jgi:creatinine amidohydrolase/Fe(II)-dependent formamide hydrolase-like protein
MLNAANPHRYEYMRLDQIARVIRECPVALQPSGLLEWHGSQNPIGLDGLVATYICERAIIKFGNGALLPTNWVGTYGFIRYPGTICYDEETTRQVFLQIFQECVKVGFKLVIILLGHWGQLQVNALNWACKMAREAAKKQQRDVRILGLRWADFLFGINTGGHGHEGETSLVWRVGQDLGLSLVDLATFRTGEEIVPKYEIPDANVPVRESAVWQWPHDLKDPSICSPEIGEHLISLVCEALVEEIQENLRDLGF